MLQWYWWLMDFVEECLRTDQELAVCQIAGHSYDLDVMDAWDTMENICHRVSQSGDVWAATHLEIVRYLRAMESVEIRDGQIINHSDCALWFRVDGRVIVV